MFLDSVLFLISDRNEWGFLFYVRLYSQCLGPHTFINCCFFLPFFFVFQFWGSESGRLLSSRCLFTDLYVIVAKIPSSLDNEVDLFSDLILSVIGLILSPGWCFEIGYSCDARWLYNPDLK